MIEFYKEQRKKAEVTLALIKMGFYHRCNAAADMLSDAPALDKEAAAEEVVGYLAEGLDALKSARDSVQYYEDRIREAEEAERKEKEC